jgi:hypothetical protein
MAIGFDYVPHSLELQISLKALLWTETAAVEPVPETRMSFRTVQL